MIGQVLARVRDREFLVATAAALFVEIGLRLVSLPRLTRSMGIRMDSDTSPVDPARSVSVADPATWLRRRRIAVDRVFRNWPFGDTCLRRALVLGWRLRCLDPVLVIGVRKDKNGRVFAHAWITVGGTSLDPTHVEYAPLLGRPGAG